MRTLINDLIKPYEGPVELSPKDFKTPIDVRWCAGCGGYAVLAQTQRILSTLKIPRHQIVFISGIGCSSRFPYYVNVYGMHTMHGRALAIASGLSIARPDLSIWIATGDGDGLSIGGNHFIHAARRNVNLNVILFNNAVYSLTKGQYSPTSLPNQITKSSPLGVVDYPFNPASLALGSGATFVARCFDRDTQTMQYMFERAAKHKGFAFVEAYTNCVIFSDGIFDLYTSKETRKEHTVTLEHKKPLIFGQNNDKGIKLDGFTPTVVSLEDGYHSVNDLLVYDETDTTLAFIVANMTYNPDLPRPMGVFLAINKPTHEEKLEAKIKYEMEKHFKDGEPDLNELLRGEDYWEIN